MVVLEKWKKWGASSIRTITITTKKEDNFFAQSLSDAMISHRVRNTE